MGGAERKRLAEEFIKTTETFSRAVEQLRSIPKVTKEFRTAMRLAQRLRDACERARLALDAYDNRQ
jgi:hypothetical protein